MPVRAEDFHKSEVGNHSSEDEMVRRNAVSRTYYSLFHFTLQSGLTPKYAGVGLHESLIQTMVEDPETKSAGWILKQARDLRTKSDYKLDIDLTLSEAETILSIFQRYPSKLPQLEEAQA